MHGNKFLAVEAAEAIINPGKIIIEPPKTIVRQVHEDGKVYLKSLFAIGALAFVSGCFITYLFMVN